MAAENEYIFSTGILLVGDIDAALTEADHKVAILKNVNFDTKHAKRDLQAPPRESLFAVATGVYNGQCMLTADINSYNEDLIKRVGGFEADGADLVLTDIGAPTFHQVNVLVEDDQGNQKTIVLYRALAVDLPLAFKMDDFLDSKIEWEAYPSKTQTTTAGRAKVAAILAS